MTEPLASLEDLDRFGIDYDGRDRQALSMLDSVSDAVRDAAGTPISATTATITIPGPTGRKLRLPGPVRSVTTVAIDGAPVTDWTRYGSELWRTTDWTPAGHTPVPVTVTFTSGYDPVPADIVRLVCSMVAAGLAQDTQGGPGSHRGLAYERVDDAQVGYLQGTNEIVDALELPAATRQYLHNRFSGSAGLIEVVR